MTRHGHCLCGRVRWQIEGAETWACFCHCADCRRNNAAPVAAFIGIPLKNFQWTGDATKTYASSPGVKRHFCETCGTPMAFQADHYKGEIHLYAASLDDPSDFKPSFHVHYAEHLPWLDLNDDLPRLPGSAPRSSSL